VARLLPVARHTHTAEQNHRVTPAVSRHTNRHCSSGPWVPTKADEAAASGPSGSELASHWPDHPALPCDLGLVRNAAPNPWHLAIAQASTPAASDPCAARLGAIGISAAVMVPGGAISIRLRASLCARASRPGLGGPARRPPWRSDDGSRSRALFPPVGLRLHELGRVWTSPGISRRAVCAGSRLGAEEREMRITRAVRERGPTGRNRLQPGDGSACGGAAAVCRLVQVRFESGGVVGREVEGQH
jgi:hypothetical protein